MAPRTRSNRVEQLERQTLLASGEIFNASGLPALPDEIYLEITSQMPVVPIPTETRINVDGLRERHLTLCALSQTCRSLRRVFLRYLWQRVEVYDGMKIGRGALPISTRRRHNTAMGSLIDKPHTEELVRQLETVTIRDPSLAQYVNVMNVVVLNYSVETVLAELARCITLLPNLHTAQFNFQFNDKYYDTCRKFLSNYSYPQIRNLCISAAAALFLASCPNLKYVTAYQQRAWHSFGLSLINVCPALEVLGLILLDEKIIQDVVKAFPRLRDMTIDRRACGLGFETLKHLSKLQHLHVIRLRLDICYFTSYSHPVMHLPTKLEEIEQWVRWCKDILSGCPQQYGFEKRLIVTDLDGRNAITVISPS